MAAMNYTHDIEVSALFSSLFMYYDLKLNDIHLNRISLKLNFKCNSDFSSFQGISSFLVEIPVNKTLTHLIQHAIKLYRL